MNAPSERPRAASRRVPDADPAGATAADDAPSRRATAARRRGRVRAEAVAGRIGRALRDARLAQGRTQASAAAETGISQPFWSRIERGLELGVSLEVLASCAAALDVQLAGFIEALPGASLPRDIQHLRRQALVVRTAEPGGWAAEPEAALPGDGPRPRSIDVLLTRAIHREAAVVEIWDLLVDGGEAMRSLEAKVLATRRRLGPGWRVQGLLVLRATRRNRALVRDLAPLFAARYPASSEGWLRALADPAAPMPHAPGLVWSSVAGDRLVAARLRPPPRATHAREASGKMAR